MLNLGTLPSILILIASAVFVVVFFRKLKLSPVLGYLVAGTIIGDHGLKLVSYHSTEYFAEFGIVFLLFAIGLEMSFERLKAMRKYVFGMGSLQVIITTAIIAGAIAVFIDSSATSIVIGAGLALSSTAVVLQVVEESGNQSSQTGRIALAILLLQDFAVVPLLVIVPILAGNSDNSILESVSIAFVKAIITLLLIFILGRLFLRPLFGLIGTQNKYKGNETFIAATLLIVLSAAWSTEYMGLSLALGAFVAGVLVAETEFRVQAEESIYPFKGIFLGLFFMSVGMNIDAKEIIQEINYVLFFSISLIIIKAVIITTLCAIFGFNKSVSIHAGLLLSQGGEFSFILFNLAIANGIIEPHLGKMLLLIVTFTMALTPLLSYIGAKLSSIIADEQEANPLKTLEKGAMDLNEHVIIAGFGRVGKMVACVLETENINYIAIDINYDTVREEFANGFPIFRGDISQLSTLKAAGCDRSLVVILAVDNEITTKKSLKSISRNFPETTCIIRTQDLQSSAEMYKHGASIIIPAVYEVGLQLGGAALRASGINEHEINRVKDLFRAGNYVMSQFDEDIYSDDEKIS